MKKSICLLLLIVSCSIFAQNANFPEYHNSKIESSELYLNGNIYQKDALLFVDLIREVHPAFAPNVDKVFKASFDIDSVANDVYKWAAECKNKGEFNMHLQSILCKLHDGHTMMLNTSYDWIYPFSYIKDDDGSFILSSVNYVNEAFLGKEIICINHKPIKDIISSFRNFLSYDNTIRFNYIVRNYIPIVDLWKYNPYKSDDDKLYLDFSDGSECVIFPTRNNQMIKYSHLKKNKENKFVSENSNRTFTYRINSDNDTCHFLFNSFSDANLNPSLPYFWSFLNEMFNEIDLKNINVLVVDLRKNSGGNSNLGDMLLSWLKPIEEIKTQTTLLRISDLWIKHNPMQYFTLFNAFLKENIELKKGELINPNLRTNNSNKNKEELNNKNTMSLYRRNMDTSKIFKGEVIFLQSPETYSSSGLLITNALDNNIGKVIGTESSYNTSSYGDLLGWTLPNTKLKGYVSHKIFLRPDSSKFSNKTIKPISTSVNP